jgi:DNA-binding MarR family transcriptional regulator
MGRRPAGAVTEPLATVETELARLTRTLEGMSRRSAIYRDMDRSSYLLARTLHAAGPSSINGLAALLGLDATTVTRQIASMERGGLVRRHRDDRDARVSRISLTRAGERRMESVRQAREARIDALLSDWPEDDRDRFAELLRRFNAAIAAERTKA